MIRIIDGVAYEGKGGSGFNVKAHELGNGHIEISGSRPTVWTELEWSKMTVQDHLDMIEKHRLEHADEIKERALSISAKRAKTNVRKCCKAIGSNQLLTLTYKANQTDLDLCKRNLKEFVRRLYRLLPQFRAVAIFEEQKRGAWHVHMATANVPTSFTMTNSTGQKYKVKSFEAIRAIWRAVTKENGGNIDLARRKAHSQRSPAKIAAYLSKYLTKAYAEGKAFSNRWTKFGDFDMPAAVQLGHVKSQAEAVAIMFDLLDDAHEVVMQHLSRWGDWFCLFGEWPAKKNRPKPVV